MHGVLAKYQLKLTRKQVENLNISFHLDFCKIMIYQIQEVLEQVYIPLKSRFLNCLNHSNYRKRRKVHRFIL